MSTTEMQRKSVTRLSNMTLTIAEDSDCRNVLQDFIRILEDHTGYCKEIGRYIEAMVSSDYSSELREKQAELLRTQLDGKHREMRNALETTNKAERRLFEQLWDDRMQTFEDNAARVLGDLRDKQQQDLARFKDSLRTGPVPRSQPSRELLNLRKIEDTLVGQKSYIEAQMAKYRADALERQEQWKLQDRYVENVPLLESKFKEKQEESLNTLLRRMEDLRREQYELREYEDTSVAQRFYSMGREMEFRHAVERRTLNLKLASMVPTAEKEEEEDGAEPVGAGQSSSAGVAPGSPQRQAPGPGRGRDAQSASQTTPVRRSPSGSGGLGSRNRQGHKSSSSLASSGSGSASRLGQSKPAPAAGDTASKSPRHGRRSKTPPAKAAPPSTASSDGGGGSAETPKKKKGVTSLFRKSSSKGKLSKSTSKGKLSKKKKAAATPVAVEVPPSDSDSDVSL